MQSRPRSSVARARPARRSAEISSVRVTTIFTGKERKENQKGA